MIKQNGYLENMLNFPNLTKLRLVPVQIHGQSDLDWLRFWKQTNKQTNERTNKQIKKQKQTNKKRLFSR